MILRVLRRASVALPVAGAIAAMIRTFGQPSEPTLEVGGWRELQAEELGTVPPR